MTSQAGRVQAQESTGDLRQLCLMGRAFYEYYQSRCSTLAIDAQFGMFQGDYMVEH